MNDQNTQTKPDGSEKPANSALIQSTGSRTRADKIRRFKELWISRNPFHEINADTKEDMFWATAMTVAEEFCSENKEIAKQP